MLLDRHGKQASTFNRCVIGDEDPRHAVHDPDASYNPCARSLIVILAIGAERRELEERRVVISHQINAVANHDFAAIEVALNRPLPPLAPINHPLLSRSERGEFPQVDIAVLSELGRTNIDL